MAEYDDARKKALRAEYIARINRVIDYIEANLDREMSLRSLAKVANFSAYHLWIPVRRSAMFRALPE